MTAQGQSREKSHFFGDIGDLSPALVPQCSFFGGEIGFLWSDGSCCGPWSSQGRVLIRFLHQLLSLCAPYMCADTYHITLDIFGNLTAKC